ncbi:MAG: hypothetical protein ABSH45_17235 [Bryobacteraceae bacterium]|jgi:uncharacterized DUF497 family protein
MAEIEGFDWDAANVGHILRHAVTPFEVEEVAGRPHVTIPARTIKGEKRWKLLGKTASNRSWPWFSRFAASGSAP